MTSAPQENPFDDATLRDVFGVPKIPLVHGIAPITDDYTAGFHAGLRAAVQWMRAIPHIEMPTRDPEVVTLHDMSALEAALHLEELIETEK